MAAHARSLRPDDPRASRSEQPLVGAGHQHVAAEVGERLGLHAEGVDGVDAEQGRLAAGGGERVGDGTHRELHAGARVRPGDRDRLGRRGDAGEEARRRSRPRRRRPGRRRAPLVARSRRARAREAKGFVGRVEVVLGGEHLVAGLRAAARRTRRRAPSWCCRSSPARRVRRRGSRPRRFAPPRPARPRGLRGSRRGPRRARGGGRRSRRRPAEGWWRTRRRRSGRRRCSAGAGRAPTPNRPDRTAPARVPSGRVARWPGRRRCRTPAGGAPRLPRRRPHR